MNELLGLPYSPWSEKARWALDIKKVPYVSRLYAPLIGEPALRLKLRRWRGVISVPVLTKADGHVIEDSAAIARWADTEGQGPSIYSDAQRAAIDRYVALSERGLAAGRALSLHRMLTDDDALLEMVPRGLRRLGGVARGIAAWGIARTLRKYGEHGAGSADHERALTAVLDELRGALAQSWQQPASLLEAFSFADIAMTQVLTFVRPPATGLRMGPASRRSFTDEALAARYVDLLAWRDALYEKYRG